MKQNKKSVIIRGEKQPVLKYRLTVVKNKASQIKKIYTDNKNKKIIVQHLYLKGTYESLKRIIYQAIEYIYVL